MDEVGKYPGATKKESDPISLARERTKTFRNNRKIYITSTPILFAGKNLREDNAATTKAAARQIITSTVASYRQTATEKGEL